MAAAKIMKSENGVKAPAAETSAKAAAKARKSG